jgi:predicted Rossmann fold flavoprotein
LGYELARQFGLEVQTPRPGLVPLLLGGDEAAWTGLPGVATEVVVWVEKGAEKHASGTKVQPDSKDSMSGISPGPTVRGSSFAVKKAGAQKTVRFKEKLLVTHRGLSGPAVLQGSSYWRAGDELVVDLAPERNVLGMLMEPGARRDAAALRQALKEVVPQRLAHYLAEVGGLNGWSNAALEACERRLHRWALHPVGTEGFEKAEVTAGGVDTDGLHARTMEARAVPGLFFIGEAVDVTGWLGGFNFQWAWASAVAAGRAV